MKKRLLLGGLLLSLCLLVGCAAQTAAQEPITLRVLTEQSLSDGMNDQVEQIAAAFMASHDGVTVEIEFPPEDEEERDLYLYQLRTEIMAGGGPDIYLMPTGGTRYKSNNSGRSVHTYSVEPLFSDVAQAIQNGIFQDISRYYDEDAALHTEDLNQTVMDAGVYAGQRCVLPLRFQMPVLIANPEDSRLTCSDRLSLLDLAEQAAASEDVQMAMAVQLPDDLSALSRLLDYDAGQVLISQSEIARYLHLYQQITFLRTQPLSEFLERAYCDMMEGNLFAHDMEKWIASYGFGLNYFCNAVNYTTFSLYWRTSGFPFFTGNFCYALYDAGISRYLGLESHVQPLCTDTGETIAEVTYFGAVGAGCENPELAYEFLREFLTEEAQWDILRPRTDYSDADVWNIPPQLQTLGFVENSWPVRTRGSTAYLWDTVQYQIHGGDSFSGMARTENNEESDAIAEAMYYDIFLTDEDLPILFTPIDEVRFPITLPEDESMAWALAQLNEEDGTPKDVDIDALAEQLYQNLWWHLAEG